MPIKFHYSDDSDYIDDLAKEPGDLFMLDYTPSSWEWIERNQIFKIKSGYRKVLGCVRDNSPTMRFSRTSAIVQTMIDKGCNGIVLEFVGYDEPQILRKLEEIRRLTDSQNKLLYFRNNCLYWDMPSVIRGVDGYVVDNIFDCDEHEIAVMAMAKTNSRHPVFVIESTFDPAYIKSQCKKWGYNVFVKEADPTAAEAV